jgi:hypothetical protein
MEIFLHVLNLQIKIILLYNTIYNNDKIGNHIIIIFFSIKNKYRNNL